MPLYLEEINPKLSAEENIKRLAFIEGEILFLGLGHQTSDKSWDDLRGLNLKGKVVVILDAELPSTHALRSGATGMLLRARAKMLVGLGAKTVLKVSLMHCLNYG